VNLDLPERKGAEQEPVRGAVGAREQGCAYMGFRNHPLVSVACGVGIAFGSVLATPGSGFAVGAAMLPAFSGQAAISTFIVTTTADSGPRSLRDAITAANANPGADVVAFDIPGPGLHTIQPTSPLPTITDPVTIDGTTQPGSSCPSTPLIELNGSLAGSIFVNGLYITAGSSTVRGLVINGFARDGVYLQTGGANHIECNFIGIDASGTVARGNRGDAIEAEHSRANVIGGTTAASRNVLSGNGVGIATDFDDADGNAIQGNFIGTDVTGSVAIANSNGILISSPNNLVGGTTPAARNLISGNTGYGIQVGIITGTHATGNQIKGNYIGTDASGTRAIANQQDGLVVANSTSNVIGGTQPGAGNLISGNVLEGVELSGSSTTGNLVQGNRIGTDVTGTLGLGNGHRGVLVNSASNNVIGGTAAGARNVISGNALGGVLLVGDASSSGNAVQGNYIGTTADGTGPAPNAWGVILQGSIGNTIGGTTPGSGNLIAYNQSAGILATAGTGNRILGNAIYSNAGLGIDLGNNGVTPNDPGDPDLGPNSLQNFPVLTDASSSGGSSAVSGTLNSNPSPSGITYRVELYSSAACDPSGNGEGASYLTFANVTTDPSGNVSFAIPVAQALSVGSVVTATATDPDGNTSEFSACLVVAVRATPTIATSPSSGGSVGTLIHDTATLSGGASPTGSVTFALFAPSDPSCTAAPIFTDNQTLSGGSSTSAGYVTTQAGTYHWIAAYGGDAINNGVSSGCTEEPVSVAKATPAITTNASPGGVVASPIHDTAMVAGGATPAGIVTFTLYSPSDTGCTAAIFTDSQTLSGGSATSADYVTTQAGTHHWIAVYAGDANNNSVSTGCTDEPVTVSKSTPTISTTPSAGGTAGGSIRDSARVNGGISPIGTVTFRLYAPGDTGCASAIFTNTQTLSGGSADSADYVAMLAGTYHWIAAYDGDSNNNAVTGGCADEPVMVAKAIPMLRTTPSPGATVIGGQLRDTAYVSGGANPTGSVTFELYGPANPPCSRDKPGEFTSRLDNGVAVSGSSRPTYLVGTWQWVATYSGDANNEAVQGVCTDESVTVTKATPTISTSPSAGGAAGTPIYDSATVTGGWSPSGSNGPAGTVTFRLFGPSDSGCASAIFTNTQSLSGGSATSANFVTTQAGTHHWIATYSGDANNESTLGVCTDEPVTVSKSTPTISTTPSAGGTAGTAIYDSATVTGGVGPSGTVTFSLYAPADLGCASAVFTNTRSLSGGSATSADYVAMQAGTYHWIAVYDGDANNNIVTGRCTDEPVTVRKATPTITTTATRGGLVGTPIHDTASFLNGANPTGSVRFKLFGPTDSTCVSTPLFDRTVQIANGIAVSPDFATTQPGQYHWTAAYLGDAANSPAATSCADEPITVAIKGILFFSDRGLPNAGQLEIWVMRPDGSGATRLTYGSTQSMRYYFPAASPDPARIVVVGQSLTSPFPSDLYVMNFDGTQLTRLTNLSDPNIEFPAWSPDGKKIAFRGSAGLYVVNADGSGTPRLISTDNVRNGDSSVSWSPDSKRIAYASFGACRCNSDIYVINADGSGTPSRLTSNPATDSDPAWSPDGSKIAFNSFRAGNYEIYVMNANGTGSAQRLTFTQFADRSPVWSPDGKRIAFDSYRNGNYEVFVMNSDGTNPTQLTSVRWNFATSWSR
jgi:WD40-like Beta Propeller Repeat